MDFTRARAAALAALLFICTTPAHATLIEGGYTVNAHENGDGLLIGTSLLNSGGLSLNLDVGTPQTVTLFDIWADESDVAPGEDMLPQNISVNFTFTNPSFGGTVDGFTFGYWEWTVVWYFVVPVPTPLHAGAVVWYPPVTMDFGNGGRLQVALSSATFSHGAWGLGDGRTTIEGRFELLSDSASVPDAASLPSAVSVPEPGATALLGLGLLATLAVRRTRARV